MANAKKDRVVSYFYHEEIGNFCYGGGNPMRPHRARLVFSLLKTYGLTQNMSIHRPAPRSFEQLTEFHADDYINFLRTVTPSNAEEHMNQLKRFNMGQIGDVDCPVFDGVYEYCQIYAGGSVAAAAQLASGEADVAFNWSGGMHHAKKAEASGFCYVNDIVLGILELLKVFPRVLYVDIDIHHGDGVEEAFYLTDRVMTVSFHKYGEFFPGTGALEDVGYGKGKYYCVNVPLKDGMDDDNYQLMFEPIMSKVMEMFQPGAIVMCCGADSLSGDKLGCFNLSMEGHSHCIEFLAKYGVPMLVLGGGGYTLRNVARCWCFETGRLMGVDLPDQLPKAALDEYNYYLDTGSLRISVSNMKNMNTTEELTEIRTKVLQHLSQLPPVPSVQMTYQPAPHRAPDLPEEDPDTRGGGQAHNEARRVKPGHESDNEGDEDGDGAQHHRGVKRENVGSPAAAAAAADAQGGAPTVAIKQEGGATPAPSAMQASTLATSEALQAPGFTAAPASPLPSGAPQQPAAAAQGTPPPASGGGAGAGPMDVDGAAPVPGAAVVSNGGAAPGSGGRGEAGAGAASAGGAGGGSGGGGGGSGGGAAAHVGGLGGEGHSWSRGGGASSGSATPSPPGSAARYTMLGPSGTAQLDSATTGGDHVGVRGWTLVGGGSSADAGGSASGQGVGSPRHRPAPGAGSGAIFRPAHMHARGPA